MSALEDAAFLTWLKNDCGYKHPRPIGNGRWAAVCPLLYTCAIVVGQIGDYVNTDDRWCYHTPEDARSALEAWDGTNEPQGWHRHPRTGRRRPDGDPAKEYVAP